MSGKAVWYDGALIQVHPDTVMGMFRSLTRDEADEFRDYGSDNADGSEPDPLWHPLVQNEYYLERSKGGDSVSVS